MDWEEFIRITAPLNRPMTEEERVESFYKSALLSWEQSNTSPKVYMPQFEVEKHYPRVCSPASLQLIVGGRIKKRLFIHHFVKLLLYTTNGEGIYPRRWDCIAKKIRDTSIEIKHSDVAELVTWIKKYYYELEKEEMEIDSTPETGIENMNAELENMKI